MSKPSQVIVLGEDERHQRFVWRYLKRVGYQQRQVRLAPLPSSRGSGEQYVRENYATQVSAYRRRAATTTTALVVAIDADTGDVQHRTRQLASQLSDARMDGRRDSEAIVHLIPKRNLETWILCLTGQVVNEESDYKSRRDIDEIIPKAAVAYFDWSRDNATVPAHCIPSLKEGINEIKRLPED